MSENPKAGNAEKGYYTDAYLHPRAVVATWSKWVEVVAIEPGYSF